MNTRRDFLSGLGKIAGGVVLTQVTLPFLESCTPTSVPMVPEVKTNSSGIFDVSDLSEANPSKVAPGITGPDGFGIMITFSPGPIYRALSMRCTHQNCAVDSRLSGGEIHCACHNSLFRLDGSVAQSPATLPLTSYPVVYDPKANTVHIKTA